MTSSMWGNMTPIPFLKFRNWNVEMVSKFCEENESHETICNQLRIFYQKIHGNYVHQRVTSANQFSLSDENDTKQPSILNDHGPPESMPTISTETIPVRKANQKSKKKNRPKNLKKAKKVDDLSMTELDDIIQAETANYSTTSTLHDPRLALCEKRLTFDEKKELLTFLFHPKRKEKHRITSLLTAEEFHHFLDFLPVNIDGHTLEYIINTACQHQKNRQLTFSILRQAVCSLHGDRSDYVMTPELEWIVAIHEAGHAVAAMYFQLPQYGEDQNSKKFEYVTINPRNDALGFLLLPSTLDFFEIETKKRQARKDIQISFAGFISEMLFIPSMQSSIPANNWQQMRIFQGCSKDSQNDFSQAWHLAKSVCLNQYQGDERNIDDDILNRNIERLLDSCYKDTITLIRQNEKQIKIIANALIEKEDKTISYAEAKQLLQGHPFKKGKSPQPGIVEGIKSMLKI